MSLMNLKAEYLETFINLIKCIISMVNLVQYEINSNCIPGKFLHAIILIVSKRSKTAAMSMLSVVSGRFMVEGCLHISVENSTD